jgi:hypothetical protein
MAPLPDYDQLKSAISRHWDPRYPESAISDKDVVELCILEAEEQNLSLDEFLLREATGTWVKWIDRVLNKVDNSAKLSPGTSKIEKGFSDNEELKIVMTNDAVDEKRVEEEDYKFLRDSEITELLAVQDISSYKKLNELAEKIGVKSWQLTEYIETLIDDLGILPLHYEQNSQTNENQQATAPTSIPVNDDNTTYDPSQNPKTHEQTSSKSYLFAALISGIGLLLIILIAVISGQNNTSTKIESKDPDKRTSPPKKETRDSSAAPQEKSIYFNGINLPITNNLCNQKESFCIYNLAELVNSERGSAYYRFSETNKGKLIQIDGEITISKIERNGGSRIFTFNWEDNRQKTTPGFAAAGYFRLDQDKNKAGILTRFVTTRSYGDKTPVGLENTSYLFPQ